MLKEKNLRLFPAFALAFVVAASGVSSQALADNELTHVIWYLDDEKGDGIGDSEVEVDEDGQHYLTIYDEEGKFLDFMKIDYFGNPNPDGGSTGLVDAKAFIEEAMKNGGAETVKENHFLQTTLGQTLIKHSDTGSIIPYHNPVPIDSSPAANPGHATNPAANGLNEDPLGDKTFELEKNQGGSLGGGWYDPMGGSMVEQMIKAGKKNKGKDNKGSGDAASDAHDPGYDFPADPALVNPVPIQLPRAKPTKNKVQHVHAPALKKKSKKQFRRTSEIYPTIPNLPAKATTNRNLTPRNAVLGMQRGVVIRNIKVMRGLGGMRRTLR